MSRFARAARLGGSHLLGALLGLCASGCIDAILIEEQQQAATPLDAEVQVEDDSGSDVERDAEAPQEPTPPLDAGTPGGNPTDAGSAPTPMLDAGRDAGRDAGPPPPRDAGASQDAGCEGGPCDAGPVVLGPCGSCEVSTLAQPAGFTDAVCDNGAPKVCWSNPVGECTYQCPNTPTCSKDDLDSCGPGRYCHFPKSDCGASTTGFCAPAPKECNASMPSRVCGCDGFIYTNPCLAAQAGSGWHLGTPEAFCKTVDQ